LFFVETRRTGDENESEARVEDMDERAFEKGGKRV